MTAVESPPETVAVEVTAPAQSWVKPLVPWVVLGAAAAAFCYSLPTIRNAAPTSFGLLATASPAFAGSILLATVGLAFAVRYRTVAAAAAATILMIVIQRLPSSVCTDVPIFSWLYKHLGVVDYIQHEHALARGVDLYHGWPGIFALTAWFSDLTRIAPMDIAHWFTISFHLFFALVVYGVARAWGLEPLRAITAVFLVASLNWVAQDYYSPQATAICFAFAFILLAGLSRNRPVGTPLLILLFAASTMTHQLTPYWMLLATGVLVISGKLKPRWIVLPLAAILFIDLAYNYGVARQYLNFSFDIWGNSTGPITTIGSIGQQVASLGDRILAGSMWLSTLLTLAIRRRRKEPYVALTVLALSPLLIILGSNYGGEAIFRVYLYSLIGCSIVLAPVIVSVLQAGILRFAGGVLALCIALVLSGMGYFGAWFTNVMTKDQVDAGRIWLDRGEFPSYFTPATIVFPQRSTWRYVEFMQFDEHYDDPIVYDLDLLGSHFTTDTDYDKFKYAIASRSDATTYLAFTEQMKLYVVYFGLYPEDAMDNLEARVKRDPAWHKWIAAPGATFYEHRVDIHTQPSDGNQPSDTNQTPPPSDTDQAPPPSGGNHIGNRAGG